MCLNFVETIKAFPPSIVYFPSARQYIPPEQGDGRLRSHKEAKRCDLKPTKCAFHLVFVNEETKCLEIATSDEGEKITKMMSCGATLAGQVRVCALTAVILLAFIACGLCSSTCECDTPQVRAVLTKFYNATRGPYWVNDYGWTSDKPVCDWNGIVCAGANLTDIILTNNKLRGTLLPDLANITSIQRLNLTGNYLGGPLPPQWSVMSQLEDLRLLTNQLTGSLPPEWSNMTKLETLDVSINRLSGPLPPQWSKSKFRWLSLRANNISGTLPPQWSRMTDLEVVELDSNHLTGSLPPEWSNMTQLQKLNLYDNQLSGPLPPQWSKMPKLSFLNLYYNSLSGPLAPCDFPAWKATFMYNDDQTCYRNCFFFSNNNFSGKLELPCLDVYPCSYQWRPKLNWLVLKGNKLCGICGIKC